MIIVFRKRLREYAIDSLMWLLNLWCLCLKKITKEKEKEQFRFSTGKDCFLWYNNNTVAQLTANIFKTAHEMAVILWVI